MQLSTEKILLFQKQILDWYAKNKRDLPWRHTRDPYKILVSEVMLQQTQVNRVITKYMIWMEKFPTIETLAKVRLAEVLQVWSGLGYNRRARYLHILANELVNTFQGKFPQDENELLKLPGIGKYTARAILCFAFNHDIIVVDTNIKKIILTQILNKTHADEKTIESIALQLLPRGKAYIWNQALMDYSSIELKKEKIVIPKQSKFTGSNRYFRGLIIKLLITEKELSFHEVEKYCLKLPNPISSEQLHIILDSLLYDSLIILNEKKNTYSLP